jgi:hypothetical protein
MLLYERGVRRVGDQVDQWVGHPMNHPVYLFWWRGYNGPTK